MTVVVDTSALYALLDGDDANHREATRFWGLADRGSLAVHGYVVSEAILLTRARLGWPGVDGLLELILPALRVELVDRALHEEALREYRARRGGTSFVDRVTIAFARREDTELAFAFDPDLIAGGLRFPASRLARMEERGPEGEP